MPLRGCTIRLALFASLVLASSIASAIDATAPVEARVPFAPSPFVGTDGAAHLAYELQVGNIYGDTGPLTATSLDVIDETGRVISHLDAAGLADAVRPRPDDGKPATIESGKRSTFYLWLSFPAGRAPHTLRHRMDFTTAKGASRLDGALVHVGDSATLALGPPLRGGRWLAHEGPGNAHSHHWGSLVAVNGVLSIPQRYALDLVGIDAQGRGFKKVKDIHATTHADWFGYGASVLAVADGMVVYARDGQDEHKPLEAQPEPDALSLDGLFGNYVVIDLGDGRYAGYAHLERDSVTVHAGDRVHRGQVIGKLGQSGSSAAPHLHFQLADAATFEGSEGVPYVFSRVDAYGPETEGQIFGMGDPWKAVPVKHLENALPLNDIVVTFPGQ